MGSRVDPDVTGESRGDAAPSEKLAFDEVYEAHFDTVWNTLRRLGVSEALLEDAAQDCFVVVHRRLGEFENRSTLRTWIIGVALRVARDYRRANRRRDARHVPIDDALRDERNGPLEAAVRSEATELLVALLDRLDDEKRLVFVLADIEGMTVAEIAEATGTNANTLSSRLRSARMQFEEAVARFQKVHR